MKNIIREPLKNPLFWSGIALMTVWSYFAPPPFALTFLFGFLLLWLTFIDLKTMLLPDFLTLSGMALGLVLLPSVTGAPFAMGLIGALSGFFLFAALHYGFFYIKGYHGLGFGDVKLLAMLGAWCGALNLPLVLLIASFAALPVFIANRLINKADSQTPLPFGPFLAFGGWLSFLYAPQIWEAFFTWREMLVNSLI